MFSVKFDKKPFAGPNVNDSFQRKPQYTEVVVPNSSTQPHKTFNYMEDNIIIPQNKHSVNPISLHTYPTTNKEKGYDRRLVENVSPYAFSININV